MISAQLPVCEFVHVTQHGGLFQELVARLKGHLLQRRRVGLDGMPV